MKVSYLALAGMAATCSVAWVTGAGAPVSLSSLSSVAFAQTSAQETQIQRAFRDVVGRDATNREVRRYARLMEDQGWTAADVRRDLRDRTDYRAYRGDTSTRPNAVIRRAYQDILGRDPDAEGLQHYRRRMADEGWTEQDIREALRKSPEYATTAGQTASADRIVRRAYQEILNREPDPEGFQNYRRLIIEDGWDEHDVRQALRRSTERRQVRAAVSDAQATEIVRRAYLSVLNREPDAVGLRDYKARILNDRWTEQQVINALRDSPEYRSRNR
jgi:TorA maturation chaperone TorD